MAGGRFAGDWWDGLEPAGRPPALVVGDVAGHRSGPANPMTPMTRLRTALRSYLDSARDFRGRRPDDGPW